MSILQFFQRKLPLPTPQQTGIGERATKEAKIIVNGFKEAGIKEAIENPPTCVPGDSDGDPFAECD